MGRRPINWGGRDAEEYITYKSMGLTSANPPAKGKRAVLAIPYALATHTNWFECKSETMVGRGVDTAY